MVIILAVIENPLVLYRKLKGEVAKTDPITRLDAAMCLGISYQLVSAIESGNRSITRNTANKIVGDVDVGHHFDLGQLLVFQPDFLSDKAA